MSPFFAPKREGGVCGPPPKPCARHLRFWGGHIIIKLLEKKFYFFSSTRRKSAGAGRICAPDPDLDFIVSAGAFHAPAGINPLKKRLRFFKCADHIIETKKKGRGRAAMAKAVRRAAGGVEYTLERKRVKNINLRVRGDGSVAVSAPARAALAQIDAFVAARAAWIAAARVRALAGAAERARPCAVSPQEALALFTRVSDAVFPAFAGVLGGEKPVIRVRDMKTRWGVCTPAKRQIVFAQRLAEKPLAAVEYVVLHEYAHFVHADHSPAFWAVVAAYMPDYKRRRELLKPRAAARCES